MSPIVGAIGNALTWYNFALFMPFLHVLSHNFFPMDNPVYREVLSFLAMSVGLFVRPLGAVIFGPIGDRFGRAKAMSISICLMALPTLCIAFLPGYNSIGIWAPIGLVICRALQGISMGGEYAAAMLHFVEEAPSNKKGFYGSWTDAGSQVGVLMGCQSLALLCVLFSEKQVYDFAWRIPFLFSVFLLPFAFIHPKHDAASSKSAKKKAPIMSMLLAHVKEVTCTISITAFSAVAFYSLFSFFPYYLVAQNVLTLSEATNCSIASNIVMIFSILGVGYISDWFSSRKPFLVIGIIGVAVSCCSMFVCGCRSATWWMILHMAYGFCLSVYYSCRSAFFAEAFPADVRCTAVSLSLSLAQAVFGGLTPVVMGRLTGMDISVLWACVPIVCVSCLALCAIAVLKQKKAA